MEKHEHLLKETPLLNYSHPKIEALVRQKNWKGLSEKNRIQGIYDYVRNNIAFGYNKADNIPASSVLADGYGQCNTKASLLMALLRACGIPCCIHGFYVNKLVQQGTMKGFSYKQAPKEILHSWVEIYYNGEWLGLEGVILDVTYLRKVQHKFSSGKPTVCGFAVAVKDINNPRVEWNGNHTYIQSDAITADLGVFDTPDEFYFKHRQKTGRFKTFIYKYWVRHLMNKNVRRIRGR